MTSLDPTFVPPIIDIAPLQSGDAAALAGVAAQLLEPCEELGMFHIVGHGLTRDACQEFESAMHALFALPDEEKAMFERSAENAWGYYNKELTKNRPDWKEIFDYGREHPGAASGERPPHSDGFNRWPDGQPEIKRALLAHHKSCSRIARDLLRALSVGLGLAPDRLDCYFAEDSSFTRLNHYPFCPDPAESDADFFPSQGRLGVHHHSDAGGLTLLYQDSVAGLQALVGDRFVAIEPVDDALTVNLGDMLQIFSNDRFRSPVHRVLARSDRERYSAPFFFNPRYDALCEPIVPTTAREMRPRFKPVSWAHFRGERAAGDFADYGTEIQVDDFRID